MGKGLSSKRSEKITVLFFGYGSGDKMCIRDSLRTFSGDGGFHIKASVGVEGGRSDPGQAGRKVYLL